MASEGKISAEMAAAYTVSIEGIERSKAEMSKVKDAITSLRKAEYMPGVNVITSASLGVSDILVTKIDALEGRVIGATSKAMATAMANGRRIQAEALRAAETKTGLSGKPAGRKSAGREVTGGLINAIKTNVETLRLRNLTQITGWHGWAVKDSDGEGRKRYYKVQEKGNKGPGKPNKKTGKARSPIKAANSLGVAIPAVREELKRELGKVR